MDQREVRRLATEQATCIPVRPRNNTQHRFMNNATRSSTRSRKADENAVAQAQVTDLAAQISTQRAKLRELNDQKKFIQQKTGVKVRRPGTAAKDKLMPFFAPMEEEPPTVEFAQLYTAIHREEAAQASSSSRQLLTSQTDRYPFPYANPGFTTLAPELDPEIQGFPSSTAPPSFNYNGHKQLHFNSGNF